MPTYRIERCTVHDAAGLARNNMSAFWTDPTWILIWEKDRTLESVIEACTLRMPNNLLNDRAHKRHLKAVEIETGTVVGYVRFLLPDRLSGEWLDAQTPDVGPEDKMEFNKMTASADWTFRPGVGNIDEGVRPIMQKYMSRKEYMGKQHQFVPSERSAGTASAEVHQLTVSELEYLAVTPEYRNRGIATLLMQAGVAASEEMGIDIFMLAYKAGLGVYKKLGFDMLESLMIDDRPWGGQGEYGCYFMERTAKKT